jgi:3,4-dihydroxy 2-butanone 4-phosphate synthase / GTP cyclohydrolase II
MDLPRQSILRRSLAAMAQQGGGTLLYYGSASPGSEIDSALQRRRIARRRARQDRDCRHDCQQRPLHLRCVGGQILGEPGTRRARLRRARLLSDTPTHIRAMRGFNVEFVEQTPIPNLACRD